MRDVDVDEYLALVTGIVRDLARAGPPLDWDNRECLLCGNTLYDSVDCKPEDRAPEHHAPGCVWRRARELFPHGE